MMHQRRPPLLDPLERLGAVDLDGLLVEEDGRVVPWDGTFGRVVVWLPPVPVDGWVEVFGPLLPVPVDGFVCAGATASDGLVLVLLPLLVVGPDPVTPVEPLGRVEPWPGVDGRCWVTL